MAPTPEAILLGTSAKRERKAGKHRQSIAAIRGLATLVLLIAIGVAVFALGRDGLLAIGVPRAVAMTGGIAAGVAAAITLVVLSVRLRPGGAIDGPDLLRLAAGGLRVHTRYRLQSLLSWRHCAGVRLERVKETADAWRLVAPRAGRLGLVFPAADVIFRADEATGEALQRRMQRWAAALSEPGGG